MLFEAWVVGFPGIGTAVNVAAVLAGTTIGVLAGHRLPERVRTLVTDALGLVTLLIAAISAMAVLEPALTTYVGRGAPMLIVLGALLIGGIIGSLLRIEQRLEGLGAVLQRRWSRQGSGGGNPDADGSAANTPDASSQHRFVEGFVTASLVFCTGPLAILGSINDGLGNGAEQLFLKSALDLFAAIAFAAAFGWGVAASVVTLIAVQGGLTLLGASLGDVVPDPHLAAITAAGGLMLVGVSLRLLRIREIAVADLLPGLVVAPLLVVLAHALV